MNDIAELFNCGVRKRDNKFAQSTLKRSNCIIDFIMQSIMFYIQLKSSIRLSSGAYGGRCIIPIFLGTFKFFGLC
ncbi:hypothetical protein GO684_00100 [Wolbachia endosymbiont of Litomosoides brasiliensis]|uniref:hypothetical protein n=1 Tax=Wolbachia endosymbiont of Litomosoides brasiliensis TaxID=1812117 RepID=UPI001589CECF|nr:hypothetical protein [Wolbachia endosymbiont of Litomosoides brasiliensis]NUY39161.1 hypothetical protein [Wolbachia endosymbiont of Litomosoides brasiliensis]